MTIGERLRERAPEEAPAPGQYEIKSRIIEGPTYSIGEKRIEKEEVTIGPGEYEAPEEQKKGVTIGVRPKEKEIEDAPAPGTYETKSQLVEGPQYSIYERRTEKIEATVGPGEYEAPEEK